MSNKLDGLYVINKTNRDAVSLDIQIALEEQIKWREATASWILSLWAKQNLPKPPSEYSLLQRICRFIKSPKPHNPNPKVLLAYDGDPEYGLSEFIECWGDRVVYPIPSDIEFMKFLDSVVVTMHSNQFQEMYVPISFVHRIHEWKNINVETKSECEVAGCYL